MMTFTATWDAADFRDFYNERAAILEFDAGLDRLEAEAASPMSRWYRTIDIQDGSASALLPAIGNALRAYSDFFHRLLEV
jgi:hypothetical protein